MSVQIGQQLGSYEITSLLGKGGMGEVYRARDTKLKRDVAVKILPDEFSRDVDRVSRFQREAEVLASLNHPNIAAIYDLAETNGTRFLVLELVEGDTLADRIQRGAVPVEETLRIAQSICGALEAAHERGIIHRDLKPANVKITPDGRVKVLDFGLAKAYEPESTVANLSNSPTLSMAATQAGMILGTAAYMSPEQAKGRNVDKRTDIWAFGAVLYELLTGKPVFQGQDVTETLAAVVMKEPDMSIVPANLRRLLEKCLQKNPKKRLRDIGDAWEFVESGTPAPARAESRSASKAPWLAVGALTLAVAGLSFVHFRETRPSQLSGLFNVSLSTKSRVQFLMLSSDGRNLAFVSDESGPARLWVRPIDSLEARPIPGTDGAAFPFWSHDGKNLGFFAQGKLKKISVTGGPAETLCDAPTPRGGAWNRDGVIIFAPNIFGALFRVSEGGGDPLPVTKPAASDVSYRYPEFMEGGQRFLFQRVSSKPEIGGIYVASLDGTPPVRILPDASHAMYVPPAAGMRTGYVLFGRDTTGMALPFDAGKLRAAGSAVPVAQDLGIAATEGFLAFSASENGVLLYGSGDFPQKRTLVWLDRSGKQIAAKGEAQSYDSLALSPDESRAAVSIRVSPGNECVWLQDLDRGVSTRFTFGEIRRSAVWSPDGSYIIFAKRRQLPEKIFRKSANRGVAEELLLEGAGNNVYPLDISSDGKLLVFTSTSGTTKDDLWLLPLQGEHKPAKYLYSPFEERHAQFSPDGKWMAHSSDESGQFQVYAQQVPATGATLLISTQGGSRPRWRRDRKELDYISSDLKLMAVPVKAGAGTLDLGVPQSLFGLAPITNGREIGYQPSADGQKFLTIIPAEGPAGAPPPVTIWMNWMAGLNK